MRAFGPQLMDLLREHYAILTQETRGSLVRALMLLRSKKQLDQIQLLSLLFFLFRCRDKQLRATLQTFIKSDIRSANLKGKNNKLNKVLQNFMFGMINGDAVGAGTAGATGQLQAHAGTSGDASDIAALYSLQICIELYRKHVWDDTKTVNIVATALQSPHVKVVVAALKFFLGADREEPEDESDKDEDVPDLNSLQYRASITKKSRSQKTKLERAMKTIKRKEKSSSRAESFNFSALHLLNDPQSVAEKLLRRVTKNGGKGGVASSRELKFDVRLMMMNVGLGVSNKCHACIV